MFKKFFVPILALIILIPLSANAWSLWKRKTANPIVKPAELSIEAKQATDNKYSLWQKIFDKSDIEGIIANKDNLYFTEGEISYLLASESVKAKKPLATNITVALNNDSIKVNADFHKIVKGPIYFEGKIKVVDKKLRVEIAKVKYYSIPMPAAWGNSIITKELDKYLAFIYNDKRYQGLEMIMVDKMVRAKPDFK